jgi:peptidyl-prolyl cis-trans isomerase A (cyclophilin A)
LAHDRGMTIRFAARLARLAPIARLAAAPLLLALTAAAPAQPQAPAALPDTVRVAMTTEVGTITLDLDAKNAPVTTRNFVRYVDQRRFDGIAFYRVMRLAWGERPNGLIQAGTRGDPRRVLPPIAHEPTSATGIRHKAGTISMARNAPGTAGGDFFILMSDQPGFDANPDATGDNLGFAAFGHVVEGMDVARKIYDAPLSPTLGEGAMKGQMIENPVRVITARRIPIPPPAVTPAPAQEPTIAPPG